MIVSLFERFLKSTAPVPTVLKTLTAYRSCAFAIVMLAALLLFFGYDPTIEKWSKYLCIGLLLIFGVLHGSNDIFIQKLRGKLKGFGMLKLISTYLLLVFSVLALYVVSEPVLIAIFVTVSAYHFGEELAHEIIMGRAFVKKIWALTYGILIFLLIFNGNLLELNAVLQDFSIGSVDADFMLRLLVPTVIIQFIGLFGLCCLGEVKNSDFIRTQIELFAFYLLFLNFHLLASFTLFFIFWHSIPSIFNQIKTIRTYRAKYNLGQYLQDAAPIYLISMVSISILLAIFDLNMQAVHYIIVASICITLPHILAISSFYNPVQTDASS